VLMAPERVDTPLLGGIRVGILTSFITWATGTVKLVDEACTRCRDIAVVRAGHTLSTDTAFTERERVPKNGGSCHQQKRDDGCGLHIVDWAALKIKEAWGYLVSF